MVLVIVVVVKRKMMMMTMMTTLFPSKRLAVCVLQPTERWSWVSPLDRNRSHAMATPQQNYIDETRPGKLWEGWHGCPQGLHWMEDHHDIHLLPH